jgi:hypothetical protein
MDTYRELVRELEEMSEGYKDLSELQGKVAAAAKDDFNANDGAKAQELLNKNFGEDGIKSIEDYKNKREELINTLKKEYEITTL